MSRVALGLQVRLDSQRLPRKALLPLAGKRVIEHAMEALLGLQEIDHYLVTDEESAPVLAPIGEEWGFSLLIGPGDDVLRRYAMLAEETGAEILIRATGDNPLVSPRMARIALDMMEEGEADLTALDNLPLGTGVEVVRAAAILAADRSATDRAEREHVTLHLYRNRNTYTVDRRPAPKGATLKEGRVTLDTEEDYALLSEIYRRSYAGSPIEVEEVIEQLEKIEGRAPRTACNR